MTLEQSVAELLKAHDGDDVIAAVRTERDNRKAAARKELDAKRLALNAEYAKAGLAIRPLGPRKKTEKAGV